MSKAEQDENLRVFTNSKRFINTKPSEWSFTEPIWDFSLEAQRFATTERSKEALCREYPNGLLLCVVDFSELDAKLVSSFRLTPDELWSEHLSDKNAKIIFNWSEGMALTPPLLRLWKEFGLDEVTITDGAHRLAIARALGVKNLYILIERDKYNEMKALLSSLQSIEIIN